MCKSRKTVADVPELLAQWHWEKNGDLKPWHVVLGSHKKVWWRCFLGKWPDGTPAHDHEWEASPNKRALFGRGCPCCKGKKVVPSNCFATTHPQIAAQWHPTKNGSLTPYDVTFGSGKQPVSWKCYADKWPDGSPADDHEWDATPNTRTNSGRAGNCPCCVGQKVVPSNCFATTHPQIAAQWHPTKNGSLTPHDVMAGSDLSVEWWCINGKWPDGSPADDHEWKATLGSRTNLGSGCPCCVNQKVVPSNCLATTHPEIASQWHSTKNGSLTPYDVVSGSNKKVLWECCDGKWPDGIPADDHEWEAIIASRTMNGCPCCSRQKVVPSNCLAATHPDIAAQWHPTKNGNLTPYDVLAGSNKKVWSECRRCNGPWLSRVHHRTYMNSDCPKCQCWKGEKAIIGYLTTHRIKHLHQWGQGRGDLPKRMAFDFGVIRSRSSRQLWLIEYHGAQHYIPVSFGSKKERAKFGNLLDNIRRDQIKEHWCRDRKKNLLVIPFWDFDRIEEILTDFFAGNEPVISDPPEIVMRNEARRIRILERLALSTAS